MALYQSSVLKNYLKQQDKETLDKAYQRYSEYFLHPVRQENIRNAKEEQFQATFLTELFVNVLGYTINPDPEFDLTTEFKNQKNNPQEHYYPVGSQPFASSYEITEDNYLYPIPVTDININPELEQNPGY